MPTEVVIPMLGITIEKGKVLKWFKSEGHFVKKGEPLFEVETDKIVTDVEAPGTGILKKIYIPEGIEVPVLTLVAVITEEGEELSEKYMAMTPQSPVQPTPTPIPPQTSPTLPRRATKE